jgi:hypothetical protein
MSIQLFSNLLFSFSESVKNICHLLQLRFIFRQIVAIVCIVSILFSSPAVALADDFTNNEITNNETIIINESDDTKFAAGAVAGSVVGGLGAVGFVSTAGTVAGLSAAGISSGLAAVGGIVGGGMAAGLAVSAALPIAGVVGGLIVAKKIGDVFTSHPEETEQPIASR